MVGVPQFLSNSELPAAARSCSSSSKLLLNTSTFMVGQSVRARNSTQKTPKTASSVQKRAQTVIATSGSPSGCEYQCGRTLKEDKESTKKALYRYIL